jgi:hypothetical protein
MPATSTPSRVESASAELALAVAWVAIGVGAALTDGTYAAPSLTLVTVGTVVTTATLARRPEVASRWTALGRVAIALAALGALERSAGLYGSGFGPRLSGALTSLAAVTVSLWLTLRLGRARAVAYAAIAVATGAGVALVASSPKPPIDVWYMLQTASHGLSHGQNIYTIKWTTGIGFEQSNGFAYLPGSAVAVWPFQALFGDVRYGLVAAMALTAVLLVRASVRPVTVLAGCLGVLYAKATFGLEQAWVDPLVLAAVCASAYAVVRGRRGWAVVAFACCLAFKQQAWLLLPVAAFWKDFGWRRALVSAGGALGFMLPWVVTAPRAFYHGVIAYNLHVPARLDSLSLYRVAAAHGVNLGVGVTAVVTLAAMALAYRRRHDGVLGFLLGSAVVMATFNLANKQTFFNEWSLAAGLVLAALVFGKAEAETRRPLCVAVSRRTDRAPMSLM